MFGVWGLGFGGWSLGLGGKTSALGIQELIDRVDGGTEREFFLDNLLVRIHLNRARIGWTGLAPWEFESSFPGSLTFTFLGECIQSRARGSRGQTSALSVEVFRGGWELNLQWG